MHYSFFPNSIIFLGTHMYRQVQFWKFGYQSPRKIRPGRLINSFQKDLPGCLQAFTLFSVSVQGKALKNRLFAQVFRSRAGLHRLSRGMSIHPVSKTNSKAKGQIFGPKFLWDGPNDLFGRFFLKLLQNFLHCCHFPVFWWRRRWSWDLFSKIFQNLSENFLVSLCLDLSPHPWRT